jgi:hypothetical protein
MGDIQYCRAERRFGKGNVRRAVGRDFKGSKIRDWLEVRRGGKLRYLRNYGLTLYTTNPLKGRTNTLAQYEGNTRKVQLYDCEWGKR